MDLLNLDEVAVKRRTVTLGGTAYAVKDMTVEDFIEATKEAKAIEANKDDAVASLESTVRMIKRTIPEMTEATIRGMSFDRLTLIVRFINGELEAEASKAEVAPAGEPGKSSEA